MKTAKSPANPFPGLRPFQFHENHLFFGREGQSEELLRKLRRNRFLAVVGTSGSGKSSLVRAGLLPLLYGGFMTQAGPQWRIALFRPGKDPIHNMAVALNSPTPFEPGYMEGQEDLTAEMNAGEAAPDKKAEADLKLVKIAALETTLRRSAVGLVDYVRRARMREGENLLVVVDQFEELFRFKEKAEGKNSQDEAAAFVKLLLEAVEDETAPIYVVLTMRSDFLGDCSQFRDLPEKINESQYLIPRMTRDQRRDAITSPAAVRNAKMTQRLLNRLLNDVGDNPDQLPILQHALMRTWDFWAQGNGDASARGEIDLQHYEAIGGMAEALSKHADEAYNGLPDARSKLIAEKMFKALTETVTDSREVRRPSELREICAIAEATEEEVKRVIEVFRDPGRSFLMPPPSVQLEANTLIDISHESLIRNWALMKEWVKEEAQSSRIYRRVAEAATLYREGKEGLLTDPGLQFALDWREKVKPNKAWAKRYHPEFDATLEFLKKSEERRDELAAAEELRKQEELERDKRELAAAQALAEAEQRRAADQTRAARKFRILAAALAVMLIVAAATAVYAYRLKGVAESQKASALVERAAAEAQRERAEQETIRAQKAENTANESLIRLDAALKGKEAQKEKAEKATLAAQAQAKAAKAAERKAQLAQAEEKRRAGELVQANIKNEMNREGLEAFERGDLSTALLKLSKLLELSRGNKKGEAWLEYTLGSVYRDKGDYEAAATSYTNALAKQESVYGEKSHETASTLNKLAQVYRQQGNFKEAQKKYNKVLEIQTDYASQQGLYSREDLYDLKSELADFYLEQARDAAAGARDANNALAELERQQANEQTRKPDAEVSIEREKLNKEVADLRQVVTEKYEEARKFYEEVASFREEEHLAKDFSPNHPNLVAPYKDLAEYYQGREGDINAITAKGFYDLARIIRESRLNPEHKDKAEVDKLGQIADAYARLNRERPAQLMYGKMIEVARAAYVNNPGALATVLSKVGTYYRNRKLYAQAEATLLDALQTYQKTLPAGGEPGSSFLNYYTALWQVYWQQKKYPEAEQFIKKELAVLERMLQKRSTVGARWSALRKIRLLAFLYQDQNDLPKAETTYKQALNETDKAFGKENAASADSAYYLGHFYFEQKRDSEAEPLLKRAEQYYASKMGTEKRTEGLKLSDLRDSLPGLSVSISPDLYVKTLSDLASINSKRGDNQEADRLYKEMNSVISWVRSKLPNEIAAYTSWSEKEKQAETDKYAILLAEHNKSYAEFLKKTDQGQKAAVYEQRAKQLRDKLGDYEEPPPWIR